MDDPTTWKRDETPKSFFSPLKDNFVIEYRDDDNKIIEYIIKPLEIMTYPTYLGNYLINKIVDAMINERKLGYISPEKRKELQKGIEV